MQFLKKVSSYFFVRFMIKNELKTCKFLLAWTIISVSLEHLRESCHTWATSWPDIELHGTLDYSVWSNEQVKLPQILWFVAHFAFEVTLVRFCMLFV